MDAKNGDVCSPGPFSPSTMGLPFPGKQESTVDYTPIFGKVSFMKFQYD